VIPESEWDVAIALAMAASLARGHGISLLLAGMAGGAAIASLIGLRMRPPEELARAQRDSGATSISTFEG
jgi:hypothetical protein